MKLYTEPTGAWTVPGQQSREAERQDVPGSPAELAAWLNARGVPASPGASPDMPERDAGDGGERPPLTVPDACPKCTRTPRAAEKLAQGDDVEAIAAWILAAQGWQIEALLGHVGARVAELARGGAA